MYLASSVPWNLPWNLGFMQSHELHVESLNLLWLPDLNKFLVKYIGTSIPAKSGSCKWAVPQPAWDAACYLGYRCNDLCVSSSLNLGIWNYVFILYGCSNNCVCVCVYMCIYTYIYICTHTYIYIYQHNERSMTDNQNMKQECINFVKCSKQ